MKDKSKRLTVVNTEKKPSEKKEVQQVIVQPSSSSSSHAPGFNPNLYLLKSVWDSVFEIKTDVSGQKYIFGKLPVVTKYGITMYADDGNVEIPQLAEGLPYDQRTIWFNPETKQIEVIGGTGGGVADSVLWDNVEGKPSWITNTKPKYSYSEIEGTPDLSVFVTSTALSETLADYATLTYLTGELKKYVTLDGAQDIKGVKNFVNGLKIGGMPITKKQDDVIYIDANLVVRGGITMYAENEVDIPSILDSLPIASNTALGIASFDSTYFNVDSNGMVSLTSAPSSGASSLGELLNVDASIDATASVDRVLYQPAGSATWTWKELTSSGVVGDYLPLSGGRLYGNLGINIDRSAHGLHVKGSVAIGQNTSGTATIDAFGSMAVFGCDVVINGVFQANKTAYIAANGNNGCVSVGHLDAQYKLDVLSSNHQVLKIESTAENLESSIRYVNKSKEVWVVGSQTGGLGNSFSFWHDNEAKTTMSIQKNGCFHVWFNGASIPNNNNTYVEGIRLYGKTKDNSWSEINLGCDPSLTYGSHSNQWVIARCGDAPYINELVFRAGGYDHFIFYRNGDFRVAGGITMYSDIRKKTKLQDVELSLSQIANAPLIQHYYNSDQEKTTHVGSIAQYWAGLNDWFCKLDGEGYYTMEIQNAALASAISIARHLEKYESKTDKKIRMLKNRVKELEDKLERLEGGNYGSR